MLEDPTWKDIYAPRGYLSVEGDYIKRVKYGHTLEKIAHGGADAFYKGEIAESMVKTIKTAGGVMTEDDVSISHPQYLSDNLADVLFSSKTLK